MPGTGEQMNTQNILQLVKETTPGTYNANGERLVMVSMRGEFAPEEAWASFRPYGFNEDAWHALERTHRVWSGNVRWDYRQAKTLLEMLCGEAVSDVTAGGKRTLTFTLPESGPRNVVTYTLEYGLASSCDRCPYGLITAISLPAERTADTVEGQITIIAKKPTATNVAMTGYGSEASDVYTVAIDDQTGDRVLTFYKQDGSVAGTVTIADTDEASDVQTKVRALGAPYDAATVA